MQRDKSQNELSKNSKQQFKSLIIQQKEKQNNIGQIIETLIKKQSSNKTRNENQANQTPIQQRNKDISSNLQYSNGLPQSIKIQKINFVGGNNMTTGGGDQQRFSNIQKQIQSLTPIKIVNQKQLSMNELAFSKIQKQIKLDHFNQYNN